MTMLQLTLIRHAKSSLNDALANDYERPLDQSGLANATLMGRILRAHDIRFDLMISSPAQRASTTAELLAGELGYAGADIVYNKSLYGADVNTLLEVVHTLPDNKTQVALVAHNPGLTEFCDYLCNAAIGNMPTCSVASIRLAVDDWSAVFRETGALYMYEYPGRHAG
jgi:phosphohistidine phosphatase